MKRILFYFLFMCHKLRPKKTLLFLFYVPEINVNGQHWLWHYNRKSFNQHSMILHDKYDMPLKKFYTL